MPVNSSSREETLYPYLPFDVTDLHYAAGSPLALCGAGLVEPRFAAHAGRDWMPDRLE